jgi:RpiR family transcriptional regulator, carbohydrate utilization regulator
MPMVTSGSCLARIRAAIQNGSGSTVAIGRFVLKAPYRARSMSIGAIAKACGASPATVYRFCRDLGYNGYKGFQLDLAAAVAQNDVAALGDFAEGASPKTIIRRVFEYNRQSLADSERMIDQRVLTRVARLIERSRRVLFLGIGASGMVARWAAQRFLSLGFLAVAIEDPYTQIFATENVGPQDVVMGISHTGQTAAIIEAIRRARRRGARTVTLTNYPHSPLARAGGLTLITAYREHRINAAISSSIIAQFSVIGSLYFILGSRGGQKAKQLAAEAEQEARRLLRADGTRKKK